MGASAPTSPMVPPPMLWLASIITATLNGKLREDECKPDQVSNNVVNINVFSADC